MELPPFLLDQWIEQKHAANSTIQYDLASSTGPVWTLRELLALSSEDSLEDLLDTPVSYTTAAGTPALRNAIGIMEGVDPDHVQVVTGASEALFSLFFGAAEPGANVVLPNPGFPANSALPESLGIEIRYYTLDAKNQFRVDSDEIRRLIDRNTRILLINTPHNPTGSVLSDDELQALHDFCAERGILFVVDQVYHPIYYGAGTRSAARLPHATIVGDLSKALCLSGLRIGWTIEHDPVRRERFRGVRNYLTITGNVFGEKLATLAVRHSDQIYARAREIAGRNLAVLDQLVRRYPDFLQWCRPGGGMTAFPWLVDGSDTRGFCQRLAKRGVLVVPGDCFGQPSHIRVGFAASGQLFPEAIERVADFLDSESRARPATAR
jgi:aspartate/methionine/tyrosine aminotransferase